MFFIIDRHNQFFIDKPFGSKFLAKLWLCQKLNKTISKFHQFEIVETQTTTYNCVGLWFNTFKAEGESRTIAWNHAVQRCFEYGHIDENTADYLEQRGPIDHPAGIRRVK